MNLYHIERSDQGGYDTYSDAVVVASTEDDAKWIHPNGSRNKESYPEWHDEWVVPNNVKVMLIGVAREGLPAGLVVCASYHAG